MTFYTIQINENETIERDNKKEVTKIVNKALKKGQRVKVNGEEVKE